MSNAAGKEMQAACQTWTEMCRSVDSLALSLLSLASGAVSLRLCTSSCTSRLSVSAIQVGTHPRLVALGPMFAALLVHGRPCNFPVPRLSHDDGDDGDITSRGSLLLLRSIVDRGRRRGFLLPWVKVVSSSLFLGCLLHPHAMPRIVVRGPETMASMAFNESSVKFVHSTKYD